MSSSCSTGDVRFGDNVMLGPRVSLFSADIRSMDIRNAGLEASIPSAQRLMGAA
ncbi:MAG: hypothetical protein ACLTG4_09235 [Oscillospiraceae bacterium]